MPKKIYYFNIFWDLNKKYPNGYYNVSLKLLGVGGGLDSVHRCYLGDERVLSKCHVTGEGEQCQCIIKHHY